MAAMRTNGVVGNNGNTAPRPPIASATIPAMSHATRAVCLAIFFTAYLDRLLGVAIGWALADYGNLTAECTFSAVCGSDDLGRHIKAGEVEVAGLEASWNHELAVGQALLVPIAVSHTCTETEILEAFTSVNPQYGNVEAGLELPYVPPGTAPTPA